MHETIQGIGGIEAEKTFTPSVSVIIPTRNRRHLIGEAIESVLTQQPQVCEVIVVDDGSTDDTVKYIQFLQDRELPITLVETNHVGAGRARNAGIEIAKADIIRCMDDDDKATPWSMKILLAFLQNHPEFSIVYGNEIIQIYSYDENNNLHWKQLSKSRFDLQFANDRTLSSSSRPNFIQPQTPIRLPTALVRKSVFRDVGLFDPRLMHHEDSDWFDRVSQKYKLGHIVDIVCVFRVGIDPNHALQISNEPQFIKDGRVSLELYVDRRQKRGVTAEEIEWVKESYKRFDQLEEIFPYWEEGLLSDKEYHGERRDIFRWPEYG